MNCYAVEAAMSTFSCRMTQLSVVLVFLLLTALAPAQTFRGAIQGSVLDSSGAAILGAQVKVTSADTNLVREAVTDESGNYSFTELPLGAYNVTAIKQGFRGSIAKGIQVAVATSQRVDLTLTPGEAKEVVEVRAEVPLIDTIGDTHGGTVDGRQAAELPINGRDFGKAVLLVPGAASDPSGVSDSPGAFGTFSGFYRWRRHCGGLYQTPCAA